MVVTRALFFDQPSQLTTRALSLSLTVQRGRFALRARCANAVWSAQQELRKPHSRSARAQSSCHSATSKRICQGRNMSKTGKTEDSSETCRSHALGFRSFLSRRANKATTSANQCGNTLWGSLRHNPACERSRLDRALESSRLLICLEARSAGQTGLGSTIVKILSCSCHSILP